MTVGLAAGWPVGQLDSEQDEALRPPAPALAGSAPSCLDVGTVWVWRPAATPSAEVTPQQQDSHGITM